MKKQVRLISLAAVLILLINTFTVSASAIVIGKDGFYYEIGNNSNDYVTLKEYRGSSQEITIPSDFYGSAVVGVDEYAFLRKNNIVSVTIPDTITSIGNSAFYGCSDLESITIPNSVVTFGNNVFAKCDKLTIYCYSDSEAEKYALDNGINYTLLDSPEPQPSQNLYLYGDIDLNNTITSADSLMILRHSVGLDNLTEIQEMLCDVDGDKNISSADALDVLRYSVQLPAAQNSLLGQSLSI